MKKLGFLSLLAILLLPAVVLAAGIVPDNPASGSLPGTSSSTFTQELGNIIKIVLVAAGLLAVAFIIWGGFMYITSRGNEELATEAKNIIRNAIIGLVVIILSYVIVVVIARALIIGPTAV
jgi:glucose uptake protein GlcU